VRGIDRSFASDNLSSLAEAVERREFDFARAAPHLLAGSFITFLAEAHGIAAVKTLWREGLASAGQATGASAASLPWRMA
jgi:hypothetical protein